MRVGILDKYYIDLGDCICKPSYLIVWRDLLENKDYDVEVAQNIGDFSQGLEFDVLIAHAFFEDYALIKAQVDSNEGFRVLFHSGDPVTKDDPLIESNQVYYCCMLPSNWLELVENGWSYLYD